MILHIYVHGQEGCGTTTVGWFTGLRSFDWPNDCPRKGELIQLIFDPGCDQMLLRSRKMRTPTTGRVEEVMSVLDGPFKGIVRILVSLPGVDRHIRPEDWIEGWKQLDQKELEIFKIE